MVDTEIIQRCLKGDRRGHQKLYEACIPYVYTVSKRYISDTDYRMDVIQEAFAKVFLHISRYDSNRGEFKPWIRKIVVNECLMHLRKNKKLGMLTPIENVPNLSQEPDIVLDHLTREDIENLLISMPKGYKMVFMLYIIDGYNHKEIGALLSINADTSRSQLTRAKRWIRNHLSNQPKFEAYGQF